MGLLFDDHYWRLSLEIGVEGWDPGPGLPFRLYDFTPSAETAAMWRELSYIPWWSAEDLSIRFFRPLSSLFLWIDFKAFAQTLWIAHLHSIAWFLALVAVVVALHRRVIDNAKTAMLASVMYAIAVGPTAPAAWISARHTTIASVFGLLALVLHLRRRETGSGGVAGRVLPPILVGISMLGGELSVAALALIFAYELLGRAGIDPLRRRLAALLPYAALAGAYLVFYTTAGYGARATGLYVSPVTDPLRFLAAAALRVPIFLGELVAVSPALAVTARPDLQPGHATWGLVTTALVALMLFVLRRSLDVSERRALRWLVPGALVSLLPGAAGVLGGRALLPALVASTLFVAILLRHGLAAAREKGRSMAGRVALWLAVIVLGLAHLVYAPFVRVAVTYVWTGLAGDTERIAAEVPDCGPRFVVLASHDPTIITYVPAAMTPGRVVEGFRVLSAAPNDHRLENVTASGFDVVVVGERGVSFWERVYRDKPLRAGDAVELSDLRVEVIDAVELGPTRLRVDLRGPLVEPGLCLLVWRDGALRRIDTPVPGEVVELPYRKGPMGI
jgi:hypothetical protein